MAPRSKRIAVALALVLAAPVLSFPWLVTRLGGAFRHAPEEAAAGLSPAAKALVARSFSDLDPAKVLDHHAHLAGVGADGSGNAVNPKMLSWAHPLNRLRFRIYTSASGVDDLAHADRQFAARLVALASAVEPRGPRWLVMAFDRRYTADGAIDEARTEFHVANEWVLGLVEQHPDLFRACMSVHPYRTDALEALERYARRGARFVKWLPNAMGIDPSSPRCDAFYRRMKELGLTLISHAGDEQAVDAEEDQKLGNPLLLRRALDAGVRVIVAHCASLGTDEDLDDPARPEVPAFDLFLRLMDTRKYDGLVFGEISATTQANRAGRPLETLLDRPDLHPRLVNGSDYPLPAINALVRTGKLESLGFITAEERALLNEIYDYNPLLFDYVTKRTVRSPRTGARFAPVVFEEKVGAA
jgi:predicted TIM-barrel fold metal-dependent hydrolase